MTRTIAILGGTGDMGSALALRWAEAGETIVIGSREPERAKKKASQIGARLGHSAEVRGSSYVEAIREADVVVLTVPFTSQIRTLRAIRDNLKASSILVDTTVPLAAEIGGSLTRTLTPWSGSAAQQAAEYCPQHVKIVATFHTIAAEQLDRWPAELVGDALICGDHAEAKSILGELIEKIPRLRAVDVGPLEMARVTEHMTALLMSINRVHRKREAGIYITGLDGTH